MTSTPKQVYIDMEPLPVAVPVADNVMGQWKVPVSDAKESCSENCFPCTSLYDTMSRVSKNSMVYLVCFWICLGLGCTGSFVVIITGPSILLADRLADRWFLIVLTLVVPSFLATSVIAAARYKVRSYFNVPGSISKCYVAG
ncbi:hypothetical protein DYB26_008305 [Aphanomyces astaci]|uniref:Uncharacterized protein n=1 Tax=Aphanomyces astaci TaxID=112090 RepID=A0A3R7AZN5_APHAT|nr:hypothetical protein DYB34_014242 [Aphanomyces astaci]RHZ26749.1 hypothetical protein DYB26_008305 [Aphanomyces astaci]